MNAETRDTAATGSSISLLNCLSFSQPIVAAPPRILGVSTCPDRLLLWLDNIQRLPLVKWRGEMVYLPDKLGLPLPDCVPNMGNSPNYFTARASV